MFRSGLKVMTLATATVSSHSALAEENAKSRTPNVVETQWTKTAAERTQRLVKAHQAKFSLPQLRVYDPKGRLVFLLDASKGWRTDAIGIEIDQAIASGKTIRGPSLRQTVAELQTVAGRPASMAVARSGSSLVFDYWATWCVPCKFLEKALVQWQSKKPAGSVQIVKAEADLMKLERARGDKVFLLKKGPDGTLHKVELQ